MYQFLLDFLNTTIQVKHWVCVVSFYFGHRFLSLEWHVLQHVIFILVYVLLSVNLLSCSVFELDFLNWFVFVLRWTWVLDRVDVINLAIITSLITIVHASLEINIFVENRPRVQASTTRVLIRAKLNLTLTFLEGRHLNLRLWLVLKQRCLGLIHHIFCSLVFTFIRIDRLYRILRQSKRVRFSQRLPRLILLCIRHLISVASCLFGSFLSCFFSFLRAHTSHFNILF